MSMADGDLGAGLEAALGAAPEGTPAAPDPNAVETPAPTQVPAYDTTGLSPQAQNIIAGYPEEERAAAAKFIRDWDVKGFQPYAQQVQARLQPYVQLGSPDELAQVKAVFEQLKADPAGFVQTLIDNGFYTPNPASPQAPGQGQAPTTPQYYDVNGNPVNVPVVPQTPDIASHPQFKRMEAALGALVQQTAAQRQMQEQREADQQLEAMTQAAEQKHGTFNRLYVYNMMTQGLTMDAAIQSWKNEVAAAAAQQQTAPAVMGASSAPPAAPGPLLTSDDRSNALAQYLQGLSQQ